MSGHVDWVQASIGRKLSPIEAELVDLVCMAFRTGPYNVMDTCGWLRVTERPTPGHAWVYTNRDLSTCDTDALTRLVVGAAERCLRLTVSPHGAWRLKLEVWQRTREGDGKHPIMTSAPSIESVIASVRDWYGEPK